MEGACLLVHTEHDNSILSILFWEKLQLQVKNYNFLAIVNGISQYMHNDYYTAHVATAMGHFTYIL